MFAHTRGFWGCTFYLLAYSLIAEHSRERRLTETVEHQRTTSTITPRPSRSSGRRRRTRTNFTGWQMHQLERAFSGGHYPDVVVRESLAAQLQLSEARIQVRIFAPCTAAIYRRSHFQVAYLGGSLPKADPENCFGRGILDLSRRR